MEIHFQQQPDNDDSLNYTTMIPLPGKASKFKGRNKANGSSSKKYVGVRQRPSGRWVAEIKDTTQKIRMWLGTFQTSEEAARAYDEAACLLRGKNTRTNFVTPFVSHDSPLASRINNILNKRKNNPSTPKQQKHKTPTSSSTSIRTSSNDHNSCTTSSSPTPTNSCTSSNSSHDQKAQDGISFHDTYKPDFSNFSDGNDDHHQSSMSLWRRLQLQALQGGFEFDHHIFEFPKMEPGDYAAAVAEQDEFSEFERMKVERQISASLYAMNGVHEYMETVVCDPFWDLPPFPSFLYSD